MRLLFLALGFLTILTPVFAARPVLAQSEGIVAVVNDEAISASDLQERMKLIMISSGLPNSPEIREKLAPQILGSLIEEQLRLQEAKRLDLAITQEEIDQGFATIAKQNNAPPEQFREMIRRSGISPVTMERQIKAQIGWGKVVQSLLRPKISVSESDIDSVLERMQNNKGQSEYLAAEIFLPVDSPSAEADTKALAMKLAQEISSGKAPFFKVAQQFSKAPGAAQGGDLGWIQESQLPQETGSVLKTLAKNQVSQPVRSMSGYHILMLRDSRTISDETLPSREQVLNTIGTERLERAQRSHLLDLKSSAFIENRLGS